MNERSFYITSSEEDTMCRYKQGHQLPASKRATCIKSKLKGQTSVPSDGSDITCMDLQTHATTTILVTGAFGNVGQSVLAALNSSQTWQLDTIPFETRARLTKREFVIRVLDIPNTNNRKLAKKLQKIIPMEIVWGSITDEQTLKHALEGVSVVIHLAAIIPPLSNAMPELAYTINVKGTDLLIKLMQAQHNRPKLVFSSSVAVYGDRVENYFIRTDDPLSPCDDDAYAHHKVACESMIRASSLSWVICRLSYIVWRKKLFMDPLMFRMPLETHMEVCHTLDTGLALARSGFVPEAEGQTLNLGGGPACRTTYREYLDRMFKLFGLGGAGFLPREAFSNKGFHCGYMDTERAEALLKFQHHTLEDYYAEVHEETRSRRFWVTLARKSAQAWLIAQSPFLKPGKLVPSK